MPSFKYFSTFTGIGGFELGIHNAYRAAHGSGSSRTQAYYERGGQRLLEPARQATGAEDGRPSADSANRVDDGPLCVGYSEIDKYASEIYERHFKGAKNYGDITKINTDNLPDFDCLVGGFPCQAFSIAGKRAGFEDTRGTLFFELARILRAKQPRLFVFENVKGLLSHDGGRTFRTIIATIAELGYDAQWQVVNSKDHRVPQNRERIIIVGHLRGTTRPQVFPLTTADSAVIERINTPVHSTDRIYSPTGIGPALSTMQGGGRQPYIALGRAGHNGNTQADTAGVREASGVPRQLDTMSDTQRYKMAGNAVTTNVIQSVFERIFA